MVYISKGDDIRSIKSATFVGVVQLRNKIDMGNLRTCGPVPQNTHLSLLVTLLRNFAPVLFMDVKLCVFY